MTAAGDMLTSLTPNCRSSTIVMRTMLRQRYQRQHIMTIHSLVPMHCLSIFALNLSDNLCSAHPPGERVPETPKAEAEGQPGAAGAAREAEREPASNSGTTARLNSTLWLMDPSFGTS